MNLFLGDTHRIEIAAVRRAGWPFGHMARRKLGFVKTGVDRHGGIPGSVAKGIKGQSPRRKPLAALHAYLLRISDTVLLRGMGQ
jgi:hypothetical protein